MLFLLLLVPAAIGLIAFVLSVVDRNHTYNITLREFFLLEGVVILIIAGGFFISRASLTLDTEVWSGRVVEKKQEWTSCEHSYPCNPHSCNCDDKGNCSICWDTCYEHSNDWNWTLRTSNNEKIYVPRTDRQGVKEPPRFSKAGIGDSTALPHLYTNYIKGNPWSILRRQGLQEQFKNLLPAYPAAVHDLHYIDRFIALARIPGQEIRQWNRELAELNADLGKKKQVNIIIVAVPTEDSSYLHALEENWLGGKKNDLVVILGITEYPQISWARIMSWTRVEELKVSLAAALEDIGTLSLQKEIIGEIRLSVDRLFVRTKMAEFEYLAAGIQPPPAMTITLFMAGIVLSVGLAIYFYLKDPFDSGRELW